MRALARGLARLLRPLWTGAWALALLAAARASRRFRGGQRLYWGPAPIITNKYWSDAMRDAGFASTAVVSHELDNFKGTRYDLYHDEIVAQSHVPGPLARRAASYVVALRVLRDFDVLHLPYTGGPLGDTPLAALEPRLFRIAGIQTVIIPYGGDFWRYSWITESLMRHAMLINYPEPGRHEEEIERRVRRWMKHADVVVGGMMVEGASRWDALATNYVIASPERSPARSRWSSAGGTEEPVRIVHAPNHRGVKGTEFILEAVASLRQRGLQLELVLLEGRPNEEVQEEIQRADICIDHCIGSGYGLFAIEGMAGGATVMANLEDEQRLGLHRHFGWLEQCPLVSANIDQLEETIDHLARNPALREELGRVGIEYVRRFHSPDTARHLFGAIYRRLAGEEVDLMRLFHPLTSEYMQSFDPLRPPLRRNRPLELTGTTSGRGN